MMKKTIFALIITVACTSFLICLVAFNTITSKGKTYRLPAQASSRDQVIPNNIAYGVATKGGLGGKIIKVTNLNLDGKGSLKEAIRTKGPRLVIFEVAGVIDLNKTNLSIAEPFLTIAGQTAPSPGITLIKGGLNLVTHDIIIQHIRVRPGDAGAPKKSGFEPDGITTYGGNAYNIIIDHCSITWGVDENLSATGARKGVEFTSHKVTFSNNIIAEGLLEASHSKGEHSMGSLVHDFVQDIAIVGNLYSCNNQRNPFFKAFTKGAVINNVIYNPGNIAIQINWVEEELAKLSYPPEKGKVSIVGNVLREGPNTKKELVLVSGRGDIYMKDNLTYGADGKIIDTKVSEQISMLKDRPSWPSNFTALSSSVVIKYVIGHAGARPKDRDPIDKRIVGDFENFKGRIISSQTEVGGYPKYDTVYRKLEVPVIGIDQWLAKFSAEVE